MISRTADPTIRLLQQTLDQMTVKASVVAANMANVDTPGYRAMRATFEDLLDEAGSLELRVDDPGHLGGPDGSVTATLQEAPVNRMRLDGNTVDLDQEMTALAALRGRYNAATQMVRKRFALLRYAASDGRS